MNFGTHALRSVLGLKASAILALVAISSLSLEAQVLDTLGNTRTPLGQNSQRINHTPKLEAAPRPPMGWNSWDNFGLEITEAEFKTQVDFVAANLKPLGYRYMVIDAGWYARHLSARAESPDYFANQRQIATEVDAYGRWIPATNLFPSAADGTFRSLAAYVHGKGLKFGLHIQRGIPWTAVQKDLPIKGTPWHARDIANPADCCPWFDATVGVDMSKPGAQEYYNSCYEAYAEWGLDFVKVDDMSRPYHADEITGVRLAIEHSGRPIVFSLSPGVTPISVRYHVQNNADMWRVSDDFWDTWPQLKQQFQLTETWLPFAKVGHWADLDMIPVGMIGSRGGPALGARRSRLTADEKRTMLTLWCIARSPLMLGGDLTTLDNLDRDLITRPELIQMNQEGEAGRVEFKSPGEVILAAQRSGSDERYLACFNLSDQPARTTRTWKQLGFTSAPTGRELWSGRSWAIETEGPTGQVPAHGVALYLLRPKS